VLGCLFRSVAIAPTHSHDIILFSLADFLARIARFKDALRIAKRALALNSASPSLHFLIANIYAASVSTFGRSICVNSGACSRCEVL